MSTKRFTMRDEKGDVVAGLENVEEGNALLWNGVAYDKGLLTLDVGETAHGTGRGKERYDVTRTE